MTANKVTNHIESVYGTKAEFLWESAPEFSVFRNGRNKKWFAVIMRKLPKRKFGIESDGTVDVINLKCEPMMTGSFIDGIRVFPAYHMNKQHWISVFLDGSCNMDELKFLIDMSYSIIDRKK